MKIQGGVMPYNSAELELISIATELVDQRDLVERATLFLNQFPKSLGKAKNYFSTYLEYQAVLQEYYDLKPTERQNKDLYFKNKLATLEKNMRQCFKQLKNDPNKTLKKYLQAHFELECQFDNQGRLSVKPGSQELDNRIEHEMQSLAESGFSPAEALRAKTPTSTREVQQDAYTKGALKGNNLQCKIKLADMYLNAKIQGQNTNHLGITEQQAVDFIKEGIKKGMPTAIASLSTFLDNYVKSAPYLYSNKSSSKDVQEIATNGQLALTICSDPVLKAHIQNILKMGSHTANEQHLEASKKLRDIALKRIPEFASSSKLSKEHASQIAKELNAQVNFTRLMTSLANKIAIQEKKYQKKLNTASVSDTTSIKLKINALKKAHQDLELLQSSKASLEDKLTNAKLIVATLNKNTAELPSSNHFKISINQVIAGIFKIKNYIKPQSIRIAKKAEQMLFEFQHKSQGSIKTIKEGTKIEIKPESSSRNFLNKH